MSAKWRALQQRHRYTYSAVVFPSLFTESLSQSQLPLNPKSTAFFTELNLLISQSSFYSQVSQAKKLATSFTQFLSSSSIHGDSFDSLLLEAASKFYLQILFLENSLPLHRTLISALCKINSRDFQSLIAKCFRELCEEYSSDKKREENHQGKRFCLSRAALSILGMPKLGYLVDVVEYSAVFVAWDVVLGLDSVVSETLEWARPSPIAMEQCQDALSCSYYLLQRFPAKFKDDSDSFDCEELNVLGRVLGVLVRILKSMAFTRDCFVAAGVSLFAALQVCLSPEELGLVIIEGIFKIHCNKSDAEFKKAILKVPFKGDLRSEMFTFSVLSRLCLIRGILTAVPRTVLNSHFVASSGVLNGQEGNELCPGPVKTILYDGILPELCNYCENPIDSHFNFHSLTVLQICLQQMKTSLLANLTDVSDNYDPIPEEMGSRILKIIWNNLEDPLSQTVKQVHQVFDLFLDIQSSLCLGDGSQKMKLFLQNIASDLLRLGPRCKGRYAPLGFLTKRLGPKAMLEMSPHLLLETAQAYVDDDVCCAVTTFLKCFLECLRDECWSSNGVEKGYAVYRGYCIPPFLYGLAAGMSKLRANLNTYALPVLLEVDVDSIFPMLAFISVGPSEELHGLSFPELGITHIELGVEQKVAVLVSLLKVCRSLALLEGDINLCDSTPAALEAENALGIDSSDLYAVINIKSIEFRVLVEWLALALSHTDELLRVDAAELLFLNPKTASLPSYLELTLLKKAIPLNMRSPSTGFQMKWTSLFRKFFSRVRTALERQFKLGTLQPFLTYHRNESQSTKEIEETAVQRAGDLFNFMRWLSCFLFFSCYPSAPYRRKIMATELILIMLNVWSILPPSQDKCSSTDPESYVSPYSSGITSPDSTLLLVGSIIDSWDRLRENAFRMLLYFPTPLPGISSEDIIERVVVWAKNLVCSPRVRESDAGALTLKLIFRKYVVELGWVVRASADVVCIQNQCEIVSGDSEIVGSKPPVLEYINSLIDWLDIVVEEGERNLSEACKSSFVHGVLLALRYTFDELDWNSDSVTSSMYEFRLSLQKLLELVMRITSIALWVVSADALCLPDMDEMADDDNFLTDEVDMVGSSELGDPDSKNGLESNPQEQIVMVGCWLAMKEVSLLLGTIIRKIPLPSSISCSDSLEVHVSNGQYPSTLTMTNAILDLKQLEGIGNHFLEVLLKMKHNGAIDKTRAGFTALCNRLLCSNNPRLCRLTESWMEQLMERTVAKGQIVDDLLRRSAGIPAAFIALFLSEPEGAPKKLLPQALRWLIDVINSSLLGLVDAKDINTESFSHSVAKSNQELDSEKSFEIHGMEKKSKIRHEGLIPTVHAFNVLRAAFNDTNLATDTSGFAAEGLIISVRSFSSPYWEVRNSACQAYTALVRRMIGFLNVQKRESARRALSGLEFFHRYPSLHPFFYNELKAATDLLMGATSGHTESNLAKAVHPSLFPILILLSRLKPSPISSESGDDLDPFLFMPFIRRCSTQSNLRVRVLASKALVSLVSNEKLSVVLLNIASELPYMDDQTTATCVSSLLLDTGKGTCRPSFNSVHGMLLQVSSLLDVNCRDLADFTKREKILEDLIQVLATRSWLASPKWCPCPILNASFLKVLDHMLSIARTGNMGRTFYAIRDLLLDLSTECLDVEDTKLFPHYDPTIAELREQAAISYFSCVLQVSKIDEGIALIPRMHFSESLNLSESNSFTGLQKRLIRSLSDSSYEVRLATMKWLLNFLKSSESISDSHHMSSSRIIQHWTNSNLQATMFELLDTEKNHRCMNYILRIFFFWNLQQFKKLDAEKTADTGFVGTMDYDSMFQLWDKLTSLYKLTRHTKTKETLICCMAICVKRFASLLGSYYHGVNEDTAKCNKSDQLERSAYLYECIALFVNVIEKHSSPSEPANMRKAAAESIIACGLLEQAEFISDSVFNHEIPLKQSDIRFELKEAVNMYAHQVLEIWFLCITLLEDEDDGIRQRLALNVQKCFSSKRSGSSHAGEVPTQVDKVIQLSFGHLSTTFGHWINYLDFLLRWVLMSANYVVPKGDPVRRVFDKEIDNHHEEKLLICQICFYHVEKLSILKQGLADIAKKQELKNYLFSWRKRFGQQLMSFAEHQVEEQRDDWIGGVGNQKDAFLPVYANLLGFYTLTNCIRKGEIEDDTALVSDVVQIGKAINPFLRNPMISNLYLLLVKSLEKRAADELIHELMDVLVWDGFDPCFLLR